MTIGRMRQEDWPFVRAIYQQGIATGNAAHLPACRLVARTENKIIGWGALSPYSRRQVYAGVKHFPRRFSQPSASPALRLPRCRYEGTHRSNGWPLARSRTDGAQNCIVVEHTWSRPSACALAKASNAVRAYAPRSLRPPSLFAWNAALLRRSAALPRSLSQSKS
jgi:hypothetical protein